MIFWRSIDGGFLLSQNPPQRVSSSPRDELEVSLTDILAPLRRHWKLVVFGTGICWAILLLVLLLAPRFTPPTYRSEAALSVPNVIPAARPAVSGPGEGAWQTGGKAGIPPVLYKKVERALLGGTVLQSAFSGKLAPAAVESMRRSLGERVSPVANPPDDTITAVRLSYEATLADQTRDVVDTLATLVREALITAIAREEINWEARMSDEQVLSIMKQKTDLVAGIRSLEKLGADLERLKREMPASQAIGPGQVVDTRDHGYLYLPPELQVIGARARRAENEYLVRNCDQALVRHTLRLSFLRRLDARIEKTGVAVVRDMPSVIGSELQAFLLEQGDSNPDGRYFQTEMEVLRDQLATFRNATQFIQYPTTTRISGRSRVALAGALATLAVVFFIAAAFVADLWHLEDSAVPRRSA